LSAAALDGQCAARMPPHPGAAQGEALALEGSMIPVIAGAASSLPSNPSGTSVDCHPGDAVVCAERFAQRL